MSKEVINLAVGSAGVNILDSIYSQLALEHQIDYDGNLSKNTNEYNLFNNCFNKVNDKYSARCVFADLGSDNTNNLLAGPRKKFYNANNVIQGKESACSNYTRGHYAIGKETLEQVLERCRKEAEKCDYLEAFHIHGSVVGGSAGLMTSLCERLSVDYGKKHKLSFVEWSSPNINNIIVECYNAVLGIHDLLDHNDYCIYWQNEKLHEIFYDKFGVYSSNYDNINYQLAQAYCDMTSPTRFGGQGNVKTREMITGLTPYPRIQHGTHSMGAMSEPEDMVTENQDIDELLAKTEDPANKFCCFSDTQDPDTLNNRQIQSRMGCNYTFRGQFSQREFSDSIYQSEYQSRKMSKYHCLINRSVQENYKSTIAAPSRNLQVNKTGEGVIENLEKLALRFDKMWSKRAHVHWYVGCGLDEGCFSEAREDIAAIQNDYREVGKETQDCEEDEEEDEY